MTKANLYNMKGKKIDSVELDKDVFSGSVNRRLLHQAVVMYEANLRSGTASTKTRAEVAGGGKKPWRQKGTGRARVGSSRNPVWRGGGVAFGPRPRDYSYTLSRNIRRRALLDSVNAKLLDKQLIVLDELTVEAPKTKFFDKVLKSLKVEKPLLVVLENVNEAIIRSSRNLAKVAVRRDKDVTAYDVLRHKNLVITRKALDNLTKRLGKKE